MNNKIFKLGYIAFVFMCVLFLPVLASAQWSSLETGLEIITDSKDIMSGNRLTILSSSSLTG